MRSALQKKFRTFHKAIKLGWHDEGSVLRTKRDIVLDKLRSNLKTAFADRGESVPTFDTVNQGSYAMHTGIRPLDSDYDIDVGLLFNVRKDDYPDPVVVKKWVYDALQDHTDDVRIRRPCVTVTYSKGGEPAYHLDLAVYSAGADNGGQVWLASGFLGSAPENREWQPADPKALICELDGRFSGAERDQFRRAICCLKRWKDYRFKSSGESAPRGIALTAAALQWFRPQAAYWGGASTDDDLSAVLSVVEGMIGAFQQVWTGAGYARRLSVKLPVAPHSDPFDRMSDKQMLAFESKLKELRAALCEARDEIDLQVACEILRGQFGEDFPEADPGEGSKKTRRAKVGSGSSA